MNKTKEEVSSFFCFFCEQNLAHLPDEEQVILPCCNIVCHKQELYEWYVHHYFCPNCKAIYPPLQEKILAWGDHKKGSRQKHPSLKKHSFTRTTRFFSKASRKMYKEKPKSKEKEKKG